MPTAAFLCALLWLDHFISSLTTTTTTTRVRPTLGAKSIVFFLARKKVREGRTGRKRGKKQRERERVSFFGLHTPSFPLALGFDIPRCGDLFRYHPQSGKQELPSYMLLDRSEEYGWNPLLLWVNIKKESPLTLEILNRSAACSCSTFLLL